MVILALGQSKLGAMLAERLQIIDGRILADPATGATTNPKYFAAGDCVSGGREVVDAAAEGKRAARGTAASLSSVPGKTHV
jgi:glutamate synthase (NADPH/NADH) small chain